MTEPRGTANPERVSNRYYSLDFWRGVACLMVVLAHSAFYISVLPSGQTASRASQSLGALAASLGHGVTLFFVISGYCITAACDAVRREPGSARGFFLRRFRRIFPPYWAALFGYLAMFGGTSLLGVSWLLLDPVAPADPSPSSLTEWQWAANLTLTEQWRPRLVGGTPRWLIGQAWSLCYEEQFYLVCGAALFLSGRRLFACLAGTTAAVGAVVAIHLLGCHLPDFRGFFFDGRWLDFAAGVWVYYRLRYVRWPVGHILDAGLIGIVALAVVAQLKVRTFWGWSTIIAWAFAALLCFLHRWDVPMARSRVLRPICFCGIMCYSLYLTHWPLTKALSHLLYLGGVRGAVPTALVTVPLCLAASVGLAWCFHRLVERRFLNTPAVMPHVLVTSLGREQSERPGNGGAAPFSSLLHAGAGEH